MSRQRSRSSPAQPPGGPLRPTKYSKLLNRFFEPLILLEALGKVRGDHPPKTVDTSQRGRRRQFRDDLAFLCEYTKGGDTCTAIACENRWDATVYWVAANVNPQNRIAPFLESILQELRAILRLDRDDERAEKTALLINMSIVHARQKITKLKGFLKRNIRNCIDLLQENGSPEDMALATWLQRMLSVDDPHDLCRLAYESRRSEAMRQMTRKDEEAALPDGEMSSFASARHYIGRLCEFVRVPQRLVDTLPYVRNLVDDHFQVFPVPPPPCAPPPQPENLTLDGICTRMLPAGSPDKPDVLAALQEMDRRHFILDRMKTKYSSANFQPRVHAEIQVLEAFYDGGLQWVDDDKHVGCSKPACYCCKMYFRHHPGRPVEPDSHKVAYCNWGPIGLTDGDGDPHYIHQRDILNNMVRHFRLDALDQLTHLRGPHPWHADSRTGITSEAPAVVDHEELFTVAEEPEETADASDAPSDETIKISASPWPYSDSEDGHLPTDSAESLVLREDEEGGVSDTDSDGGALL